MTGRSATATVETLTAEVRVLMVGNRQITQSVAKQLDRVSLDEMAMFGRVRISDQLLVIGKRTDANDLVITRDSWKGSYRKPPYWKAIIEQNAKFIHACNVNRGRGDELSFQVGSIPCETSWENVHADGTHYDQWFADYHQWREDQQEWYTQHLTLDGFLAPEPRMHASHIWIPDPDDYADAERQAAEQLAEANRRHALYEAALDLPLIVLAGLR